jgi:hypothetical protein
MAKPNGPRPGGRSGEHPWRDDPSSNLERPPFEPGNTASLVHGANSGRMLAPIAKQLEEELAVTAPWTQRPAFRAAVQAWSVAEATCVLYRAWFAERGLWDGDQPRDGLVRWDRAEARASAMRKRLSIDPASFASFLSKLAGAAASGGDTEGLEAVRREGRAIVRARELQLAGGDDDEEGDDG